jgi:hypothetical protein
MAVKMLNPKFYKYLIDTAAGSCGFTVFNVLGLGGTINWQTPNTGE